jgi:hypothetical protein
LSHGAQDRGRHSSIGALKLIAEALHGGVESSLIEVKLRAAADQLEAKAL